MNLIDRRENEGTAWFREENGVPYGEKLFHEIHAHRGFMVARLVAADREIGPVLVYLDGEGSTKSVDDLVAAEELIDSIADRVIRTVPDPRAGMWTIS